MDNWEMVIIFFLFGIVIGSFLNVFIIRWSREEQYVSGRSRCMSCGHALEARDLVPLLSWIFLYGRCRYCHSPISWRYPVIELVNGVLWGLVASGISSQVSIVGIGILDVHTVGFIVSVGLMVFLSVLLVIFVIDVEHFLIPDEMEIVIVIISIVMLALGQGPGLLERLYSGLIGAGFLGGLHVITKGKGMGLGDVKLAGALGILMGYWSLLGLMVAFWIGAVVGVLLLLVGKAKLKRPIPFGPFIVVGIVAVLVCGRWIVNWGNLGLGF